MRGPKVTRKARDARDILTTDLILDHSGLISDSSLYMTVSLNIAH
jgi:hypothetical protein